MASGDLLERWVREHAANRHAAVSCHGKPSLARAFDEQGLIQIRMVFELIRDQWRCREPDRFGHLCAVEVADAYVPDLAGTHDLIDLPNLFGERHIRSPRPVQ